MNRHHDYALRRFGHYSWHTEAMSDERLLSTAELAEWLGVTVGTIQRYAKKGNIRPALVLPGGEYRWDRSEVREQLAPKGESVEDTPNRPSVITAIVTSSQGVLIGHRHDGKPPWTFIAGEQEPGETFVDTIIREVKEETGLEITAGEILGERVHPKTGRHMVYLAASPARNNLDVVVGDPDELSEVRWAILAEADELLPGMFEPVRAHLEQTIN
jgi:excisionase family DNA binding protein